MMETPGNIRDLLAFSVAMDLKSMTGAAKTLAESKGSVSRRLSRLENQLGVRLITRSARGVLPTEAGATYHQFVKRALATLTEASAAIQPTGVLAGLLRISVSHGFGLQVLGPIIGRFANAHRALRVHVQLSNSPHLDDNDVDIAIHPDRQLGNHSIGSVRLLQWKMRFVATPTFIERCGPFESLVALAHKPLLVGGLIGNIVSSVRKPGSPVGRLDLEPSLTSDSSLFVRQSTLAGHGIGFLPSLLVDEDIRMGTLIDLYPAYDFPEYEGAMYLLHQSTQFVPPKVAMFRDFMIAALQCQSSERIK